MPKVQAPTPTSTSTAAAPAAGTVATPAVSGLAIPAGAPPPRLGASRPDQLVGGGLANNFKGRVLSIWLLPRKYKTGRRANTYSGFAEITIQADDTSLGTDGLIREYYHVTPLNQWVPSRTDPAWDGSRWVYTPAGGDLASYMKLHEGAAGFPVPNGQPGETAVMPPDDWRGFYWVPGAQNSDDRLRAKGTKWDQFLQELDKAGYFKRAPHISAADMRQFLVGVYGYWVRLPFEFSGGQPPALEPGQQQQKNDTLCLAEILDLGPISGAGGPVAAGAAQVVAPVTAPVAQAPAPVATAPALAAPAPTPMVGATGPQSIEAATNEILTQLAATAARAGRGGVLKGEAGVALYEELNRRGLEGAGGLLLLNNNTWIEGDERTFGYVAQTGMLVPLPAA